MALRVFKSNRQTKQGVWTTEFRLYNVTSTKFNKLKKLLALLKNEEIKEVING